MQGPKNLGTLGPCPLGAGTWLTRRNMLLPTKVNWQGAGAYCGGLPHSLFDKL